MVARQDAAESAGGELQRPAHSSSYAEHDTQLAIAEVQFAQNEWKDEWFERRLSVVDPVGKTH